MYSEKIDVVIPWVDGQDIVWQKKRQSFLPREKLNKNMEAQFRDWNHLKYVLRGIEKYMPWVNHIFLITYNQKPKWLKETNKLTIVDHYDYIPKKYLPTFSSNVIELNLHRIKNLSEKFIYFNDDIFVLNYLKPQDFFQYNLPCDNAILHYHCPKKSFIIHTIANNDIALINDYFNIKKCFSENKKNYFNICYGLKNNIINMILIHSPRFPGFRQYHLANSYLKSTFFEVWKKEYDYLDSICKNKFRTAADVNQWVFREWQLAQNKFKPYPKYKMGIIIDFEFNKNALQLCKKEMFRKKYKLMCINDGDTIKNFEELKKSINEMLELKFPDKSSFEK